MVKTTLKLFEVQSLNFEINGFKDPNNNEVLIKGLINEKLKLTFKYWLFNLNNNIQNEIKILDNLRNELIQKYGDKDENDNISLKSEVDGKVNPKYIEFQNSYTELISEEKELEHYPFKVSDLEGLELNYNTPILFKLIKDE